MRVCETCYHEIHSDRRTNPTRYWALLRKLSGERFHQPPNISISFGGSPLSGAKTITGAFTKQFTAVAVPGGVRPTPAPDGSVLHLDRTRRRLLRHIHRDHLVDHDFRPFSEQFYASALQTAHPSHECVTHPIGDRLMKHSLRSRFSEDIRRILGQNIGRRPALMFGGILRAGSYGAAKTRLKTDAVNATLRAAPPPAPQQSPSGPSPRSRPVRENAFSTLPQYTFPIKIGLLQQTAVLPPSCR